MRPRSSSATPACSSPSPATYGRRPIATSTTSAVSVSAVPPAAGSSVSSTPSAPGLAPVTLVDRRNLIPCLPSTRWNCLPTSESMPGTRRSRYSTTVTSAPSRFQTLPSSSPIYPPPITTRWPGTRSSSSAPVLVTIRASSTSTPGSGMLSLPVAMTMFLAW